MLKNLLLRNEIVHVGVTVADPVKAEVFNNTISGIYIECHENYDVQSKVTTFVVMMRYKNYRRMLRNLKLTGLSIQKGNLV